MFFLVRSKFVSPVAPSLSPITTSCPITRSRPCPVSSPPLLSPSPISSVIAPSPHVVIVPCPSQVHCHVDQRLSKSHRLSTACYLDDSFPIQRSRLRASLPPLLAAFHDVDCSSTDLPDFVDLAAPLPNDRSNHVVGHRHLMPEVPISAIISPRPASATSSGSPSKVCYCVERGTVCTSLVSITISRRRTTSTVVSPPTHLGITS